MIYYKNMEGLIMKYNFKIKLPVLWQVIFLISKWCTSFHFKTANQFSYKNYLREILIWKGS